MPSGAKKRKAAKKKKEKEATTTNNSASHSHDDELKNHDGKESDGGEVSSPASQDHHNQQHSFGEAEDEKVEKGEGSSSVQTSVYSQEVVIEEGGMVQIVRELKPEDKSESKDVSIEYVKSVSKSCAGSSSSSSSDDESHAIDMNRLLVETASDVNVLKPADHVSESSTQASKIVPVKEDTKPVMETAPIIDSDNMSISKEADHTNESATVCNSMISDVVELILKENSEDLPISDEHKGVSSVEVDLISHKEEDVLSTSDKNAVSSSDSKDSAAGLSDDKLLMSFDAPGVGPTIVAEPMKNPEIPESQPLVAPSSRPGQSTSWKSCCGLFEFFTSGNR